MTRRSFISDMLKCGIATTFLPGAGRIWKPTYAPIRFIVPEPKRFVPYWWETHALQRIVSNEYEEALKRILSGEDQSVFGDPPNMKSMSIHA